MNVKRRFPAIAQIWHLRHHSLCDVRKGIIFDSFHLATFLCLRNETIFEWIMLCSVQLREEEYLFFGSAVTIRNTFVSHSQWTCVKHFVLAYHLHFWRFFSNTIIPDLISTTIFVLRLPRILPFIYFCWRVLTFLWCAVYFNDAFVVYPAASLSLHSLHSRLNTWIHNCFAILRTRPIHGETK